MAVAAALFCLCVSNRSLILGNTYYYTFVASQTLIL